MKLTIDTNRMVIQLPLPQNMGELVDRLQDLFPNGEWRKYTIEPVDEVVIVNREIMYPIYPYPWVLPSYPSPSPGPIFPGELPIICGTSGNGVFSINY